MGISVSGVGLSLSSALPGADGLFRLRGHSTADAQPGGHETHGRQESLSYDPKGANSLFNLGIIRLQAKNDRNGAVTAWQQLLKLNPTLAEDKKAAVEKLIAQAQKRKPGE